MTRILVTGASGFIGQALVAAFAKEGRNVRAAVRRSPQYSFPATVEVLQHPDLTQPVDWRPFLSGIDQVIHLAGIAHISSGVADDLYDRINRIATEQLAIAAAEANIRHFIFTSSLRAQSGPSAHHVLSERDQPVPTDAYGRSKLAAERAVQAAGVPFTILRPVVLYGPGTKGNVALLARLAALPLPLPLKSFTNRRSLLGVDNFISATRFVLETPATSGETYVVADPGPAPRLADIIATMRRANGRSPLLLPLPPRCAEIPLRGIGRSGLWERFGGELRADPAKLVAAGWRPAHDTLSGLTAMIQMTVRM